MQHTPKLRRLMTTKSLVIFGLIFMVPISPFGIYGIVAENSEGMVPLAYFIGMIGMLFTALSYWRMVEVFPLAGSVYAYTSRGIGLNIGFVSGWALILDYLLVPALVCIVSAKALESIIPEINIFLWILFFIVFNTIINIRGIELTVIFSKILLFFELIVCAIFIVTGIITIMSNPERVLEYKQIYSSGTLDIKILLSGASIAVLSFMGFDSISTLAEETKGGSESVGKACVYSIIIIGILFIAQTLVAGMLVPDYTIYRNTDNIFYLISYKVGGKFLMRLCAIATGIAWGIADMMVAQVAVSRILYCMARDGFLPRGLSRIHIKYQTPYVATIFVAVISFLLTIIFVDKIYILSSIINFGALTTFMILNVTVIIYFIYKKNSKMYFKHLIFPLIGIIVIGFVWLHLNQSAIIVGIAWIIIGIFLLFITRKYFNRDIHLKI